MTFVPSVVGTVDANNSSTTLLAANQSFTGASTDVSSYNSIDLTAYADVNSASLGLRTDFSTDNSNWYTYNSFNVIAGQTLTRTIQAPSQYYRAVYTQGASSTGAFRLQSILSVEEPPIEESTKNSFSFTALNNNYTIPVSSGGGFGLTVTSMGTSALNNLVCENSSDGGVTWVTAELIDVSTGTTSATGPSSTNIIPAGVGGGDMIMTVKSIGTWSIIVSGGITNIRVRCSAYTSGTITGTISTSSPSPNNMSISNFINVLSPNNTVFYRAEGATGATGATTTPANLAAGATATGIFEPSLTWRGVCLTINSDRNLTVFFEQSSDGTNVVQSDSYTYIGGSTNQDASRMFNLCSNFHRYRVTNTSASATNFLIINCYNTPSYAPIPGRSLTQQGNGRCEVPEVNTYRAAAIGITPVTTLTFSIRGSSTKTIKVTRIGFSLTVTAAGTYSDVTVRRYSNISGGTGVTITATSLDTSLDGVATAVVQNWTTTPGTQTVVGSAFASTRYQQLAPNSGGVALYDWITEYGNSQRGTSALTLRGTSQWAGITISNLGTTPVADIWVEWIEI